MQRATALALIGVVTFGLWALAQTPQQPKVQPGPNEPNWVDILEHRYALKIFDDLLNPVKTTPAATPGLFKKAGPGPVVFTPVIALGLEVPIHGGWYTPGDDAQNPKTHELWSYQYKHTAKDIKEAETLTIIPLITPSNTTFDPGDQPFGLWIGNDQFKDRVYSQPQVVAATNPRLAKQPYKAMIYPNKDRDTDKIIPHSYIIGWEYSTNDDFQDVVTRIDNVELITDGEKAKSEKSRD
ncbi:MAG: hypothetical protein IRY99_02040 [Isosphaeraceae bacterium]|nr:hypothetical protein [Isosphaeraceae bacterium]